ncbi:MAG: hypothetical protein ACI9TY_000146 [Alphaproteobacteria bacterium]|jgi:hypothetical protein
MGDRYIPSDEDHDWFYNNHEKMNLEKESDKRLIKYYHLAIYFKDRPVFTKKNVSDGHSIHMNESSIKGNMGTVSQILNSRISKRAFWVSLSALFCSICRYLLFHGLSR